jgi:hypothetical protein
MEAIPTALALLLLLLMSWKSTRRAHFAGSKTLVDTMAGNFFIKKASMISTLRTISACTHLQQHVPHRQEASHTLCGKNRWEKVVRQGHKFSHLVCGIDNHLGLLDEGQTKDGVDGDIASHCNKKACKVPLLHEVRKVEPERCNGVAVMLDNTTQCDGRVVGWALDGGNGVGIGFGKGGKEMEVAG